MAETLPPPVIDPTQVAAEQQAQQTAAQIAEQQIEPAFTVVDKRSSAPEPYFAETPATTETDAAQAATNTRVQELVDKESFKLGSRAVERGQLGDMLKQDAIAQAAREGHDVTHILDSIQASEADNAPIVTPVKTDAVSTERIGNHSEDNFALEPKLSIPEMKARQLAEIAADKIKPFDAEGNPATMTLKDRDQLSDSQKDDLRVAAQKIGDKLSAEKKSAEATTDPSQKRNIAKRIRSLFRDKKVIESLTAEQAETTPEPETTEPSPDLMDDLATHDHDDTVRISEQDKAEMRAEDQKHAAEQRAEEPAAEPTTAPADTPTPRTAEPAAPATSPGPNIAKILSERAAEKKAKDDAAQMLKMRLAYTPLGAPYDAEQTGKNKAA